MINELVGPAAASDMRYIPAHYTPRKACAGGEAVELALPEKLSIAAPQKVDATAMQKPLGEPAMLPSQMESTTPSVRTTSDSTSNPVGTCMHVLPHQHLLYSAWVAGCAVELLLNGALTSKAFL